ncbi:MAG: class I SAM-dependent methyltransferase [Alphaproteobacteria bacterium]|nr:class I SAM-dependent methyltransferase [Alphaproteobacteria bacterium]
MLYEALLRALLRRVIVAGRLHVILPDGRDFVIEGAPGPAAGVRILDRRSLRHLVRRPGLGFGEAWMDGGIEPAGCTLYELLDLLVMNLAAGGRLPFDRLVARAALWMRRLQQHNSASNARRKIAHHYDLSGRLYSLFLDRDRQYSCAYFQSPTDTIEQAQAQKKRHIAAKLCLDRPELSVLDIGSGWGGLAITLARDHGARVTGVTLSAEQHREATAAAAAAGLSDRVRFLLTDYRAVTERFDRVVSVGMFEHVGVGYYPAFFETIGRILRPDGVGLLHAIGRSDGPGSTNPWIRKYIFPGGYSPALSEVLAVVERSGLCATDIEILRLHYAETLRAWRARFIRNRDTIAAIYDERFCRMWEFYLIGSELAFRRQGHMVWQMQFAHRQDAVPLTRDYITDNERAVAGINLADGPTIEGARNEVQRRDKRSAAG